MDIAKQLFKGNLLRLTGIDFQNDPPQIAGWTQQASYMRMLGENPAHPLTAFEIKKKLEAIEKRGDEERNVYYFHIRPLEDDRLLGWCQVDWILWAARIGRLSFTIGDPADHHKGFGSEVMRLVLRFAFDELNLHRISAVLPEYNLAGIHLLEKFGFSHEIRRREVIALDGKRYDMLTYGILRPEWEEKIK